MRNAWLGRCQLVADPPQLRALLAEDLDDPRVELASRLLDDLGRRLFPAPRAPVGAIARHRIQRVGDREDACAERYLRLAEPVRIAAPVPALVVMANDLEPL